MTNSTAPHDACLPAYQQGWRDGARWRNEVLAANQPEPNDNLRETLNARLRKGLPSPPPHVGGWALPSDRRAALVDALAPVVEAYVAAQVAAVRADALREAAAEVHRERLWQLGRG